MSNADHARQQAIAQCESIAEMVRAVELDWGRLSELRTERADLMNPDDADSLVELAEWDAEYGEELAELLEAAGEYESEEQARAALENDPLSVQVRSGWHSPGEEATDEEFEILLCTGGPAVRIRGELDQHGEPDRAWIDYQDWGTSWTELFERPIETETLLAYCRRFFYGR